MLQGFFVGGEMGGAATMVVEGAPTGRRGMYGAFLITGAGVANVFSGGLMAALGLGPHSWFLQWGWRIPFVLTYGLGFMVVNKGLPAWMGFAGTMIVGLLQIVVAPAWGAVSDRIGRRTTYVIGCLGFAAMVYPTFALFTTGNMWLIWLGQILGFVVFGVAMQAILPTMLTEMFDAEARTTGVNIGYQVSNALGGGFTPLICTALVAAAAGAFWPVVVYAAVISVVGAVCTLAASVRPDTGGGERLHVLAATTTVKTVR